MGESAPPLRLRGGGMMNDSGSSSDEDNYMSAAEELSLSPTPHYYETPALNAELNGGDLMDEKGDGKGEIENRNDPEEKLEDKGDAHTGLSDVENIPIFSSLFRAIHAVILMIMLIVMIKDTNS